MKVLEKKLEKETDMIKRNEILAEMQKTYQVYNHILSLYIKI